MFSSRLQWNQQANPLSLLLDEKRKASARILDLTESSPPNAGLEYPAATILSALASPEAMQYHPHPAGLRTAREAVASYYGGRQSPDRILLTASTSEAYGYLFKLLADPGDEVLSPRPSYPLFEFLAALEAVKVVQYPLIYEHGWMIDFPALERVISPRTRAIIVVNPNNPTGSFVKPGEFERLRRYGLPIISDEVFADFRWAEPADLTCRADFTLSGLSKVSGLPQMKLGWIVVSDPDAYARLELIADTYLSVSTPAQCAATAMLEARHTVQGQIRRRTWDNLTWLRERLRDSPMDVLEVEGGWYATLQVPRTRSEEEWVLELLRDHDVMVQPGFFYDFEREAFLVVSLLTRDVVFREGIERLLRM
ncbi:MAG TPA: pyridoxal phosphate-dependent aminotransferase [Bryobacteraceae bacterium]|nr:pyridoxal phosphate-dependent aminotransferase [Bryobacteraceae bacterium]